jgi:hypothetical protein
MSEEDTNTVQGETGTSATTENVETNNTSSVSQDVKTEKTGVPQTVPYSRFKEVNDELKKYKGGGADKPQDSVTGSDNLILDLIGKVPEHLKAEMSNIAKYAREHIMSIDDAITLWDAKNKVSPADLALKQAADEAAQESRTGGTPNPAARQETPEVSKMTATDLRAELEKRIAAGEKL